jgi:hypothetical protein
VQIAQRWILARLRNETFFSLEALSARIRELVDELNLRPMKRMGGKTRRDLFESLDKPALKPLPADRYVFGEWGMAKVHGDHHVDVDRHYYSAPHVLHGEMLDVCLTATTVELLYRGDRVALHARSYQQHGSTTLREHGPPNHREWADADPTRVIAWAEQIGAQTTAYVRKLIDMRPTGLRSALGLKRVAEPFEPAQVEAACALSEPLYAETRGRRPRLMAIGGLFAGLDVRARQTNPQAGVDGSRNRLARRSWSRQTTRGSRSGSSPP